MPLTFDPPPSDPPRSGPPPRPVQRRRRPVLRVVAAALVALAAGMAVSAGVILTGYIAKVPVIPTGDALWSVRRSPGMTFLDRNGQVIATRGAKYGQAVKLAALPVYVPKAFLAAEDRRFYQHGPVDPVAIVRAALADLRAGRPVEGASTLTQQLARTLFLKREDSLKRKVQEAYLAWKLEQALGKNGVLDLYLNRTYFGDGAYGLDAASEAYFGEPASQLTLLQAATLAGLPNAPTRLALTNDMAGALARGHRILGIMRQEGWITEAAYQAALGQTLALAPPPTGEGDEGYVIDDAAEQASQLAGGAAPDLIVTTTIDPALQAAATDDVRQVIDGEGVRRRATQGALVSLGPDGAILAMVGGVDHDKSSFNRVTQARRQPGSAFKAFVYGAAVEAGATPQDVRDDAPITWKNWSPEDYERVYEGPVTLEEALARSINTVAVRLVLQVGPDKVADFAHRLGLADIPSNPGPSIALGAYEVTPLELAAGYQVFQDGGGKTTPYLISQIRSTRGEVLYSHEASAPTPVLDPLFATRMVDMLKAVITSGTGVGANIGRPAAGKTGTSQNYRDAWFVGFTPDVLTAVWVGNDDGAPMAKVTGGELPAEIWRKFMTTAEQGKPPRDFPWLTPEPAAPAIADISDQTPYPDQPPDLEGDPGGSVLPGQDPYASSPEGMPSIGPGAPPPGVDPGSAEPYRRADGGDPANGYAPAPRERDQYARSPDGIDPYAGGPPVDGPDGYGPPYGSRGEDAYGGGPDRPDRRADAPPRRRWRRRPPPDYQDEPPPDGPDGWGPAPPPPEMPADEDPRYRY